MELTLSARPVGDRTVLAVAGEIDVYTAPQLRAHLAALVASGSNDIIVDLSDVTFLDSTGLGVFIGTLKKIKSVHGRLEFAAPKESTRTLFRITGLTKILPLHPTLDDALQPTAAH